MPTYQYACTTCGAQLEVVQKFSDDPLTECPECAGRLRKVFSAVGVVFKGSGFYRNDSRSDKGAKANGTKQKTESAASESKSDSDSGAKTESKSSDSASSSGSTSTASNGSSSSTSSSGKSEKVA